MAELEQKTSVSVAVAVSVSVSVQFQSKFKPRTQTVLKLKLKPKLLLLLPPPCHRSSSQSETPKFKLPSKNADIYCMKNLVVILSIGFAMLGCSPFSDESLIENIQNEIKVNFEGKTTIDVVSGGMAYLSTNPGNPAQNYKVTVSVGLTGNTSNNQTSGGYIVNSSVVDPSIQ